MRGGSLLLAIFIALGCGGYSIELPNEYRLIKSSGLRMAIADPQQRIVIPSNIVAYAVIDAVVVGQAEVPKVLQGQPAPQRKASGYFFLDTESGAFADDLPKAEWLHELSGMGIDEPALAEPTFADWLMSALR